MQSVRAFQIAINHEEPDIVTAGLKEFSNAILEQHKAIEVFGYLGRSAFLDQMGYSDTVSIIDPCFPPVAMGLLKAYIESSPDLEELFVLWDLPGRDEDKKLSTMHMRCFAAILHCAHQEEPFCIRTIGRIIRDHVKSLHSQLNSGNTALIHSTLGLLVCMCRTSNQSCKDVYNKVVMTSLAPFLTLAQKGKELSYDVMEGVKIHTDARYFIIVLTMCCLKVSDPVLTAELLSDKSILRALVSSLHKDSICGVQLMFEGMTRLLSDQALYKLFDTRCQERVFSMYENTNIDIQMVSHSFVLATCRSVFSNPLAGRSLAGQLFKHLHASCDMRHREVVLLLYMLL